MLSRDMLLMNINNLYVTHIYIRIFILFDTFLNVTKDMS